MNDDELILRRKRQNADRARAYRKRKKILNPEGVHRSKDSLRKSYDNLKRALREDVADEKKELYKTGDGLPESNLLCKAGHSQTLLNIINHKTIFGLESVYDGDKSKTSDTNEDSRTMTNIESEHSYTQPKSSEVTLSAKVQSPIASTSKSPMTGKKATAPDLKRLVTEELQNHWLKRRRPAIQQPASQLVAKLKQEETYKGRKQEREEILFESEKTKLELYIKNRQLQLKKLQEQHVFDI
ncbi:hypothetical protein JTB14_006254 [Gonioctena quinquepunctata]|nr:hypothetical protein JTB14_006254 [Gonioctena quinquepunctata]